MVAIREHHGEGVPPVLLDHTQANQDMESNLPSQQHHNIAGECLGAVHMLLSLFPTSIFLGEGLFKLVKGLKVLSVSKALDHAGMICEKCVGANSPAD